MPLDYKIQISREGNMYDYEPIIRITLQLPNPMSGEKIITLVKKVAENYYEEKHYIDGRCYQIGTADYTGLLLVVPSKENPFVRPKNAYNGVTIMRKPLPEDAPGDVPGGTSYEEMEETALRFTEALRSELENFFDQ
ncbi:hypothetical protein SAMN05444392_101259 [Seinonella peptonophila]|uniref:Uncharacterized protein n=1 Tax=Seinonella peptonophila TaxID=112248 RepID=A0A1M4T1F5_9BACL|nr:hypothetical protein [Seinonella peptonophila]SHE38289.1 hypothetical protein SAMN05444392_101259 [Seinonella peptonophila]